jgi:hypothetical protein
VQVGAGVKIVVSGTVVKAMTHNRGLYRVQQQGFAYIRKMMKAEAQFRSNRGWLPPAAEVV